MVTINNTLKNYADQKFISFGGYAEITKHMSTKTLINTLFFHGQTLFLTPETVDLSYDLQLYGYQPNTPLKVLNEDFKLLNTFIIEPVSFGGQIVYIFGYLDPVQQSLLYKKHATRLLFSFKTTNKNNLIEVISSIEPSPDIKKDFLDKERTILSISELGKSIRDNFTILLAGHSISFFQQDQSIPSNFLFSPLNETNYTYDDINISTNRDITFSICKLTNSPFNSLIGLTRVSLINNLINSHTKIHWDELSNTEYWVDTNSTYRLKIKLEENVVVSSSKQFITKLSFNNISFKGDLSRIKLSNGIYTIKSTNNVNKSITLLATL